MFTIAFYINIIKREIIYLIIKLIKLSKLTFYNYYYYIILIKLLLYNSDKSNYLNTRYIITLIN